MPWRGKVLPQGVECTEARCGDLETTVKLFTRDFASCIFARCALTAVRVAAHRKSHGNEFRIMAVVRVDSPSSRPHHLSWLPVIVPSSFEWEYSLLCHVSRDRISLAFRWKGPVPDPYCPQYSGPQLDVVGRDRLTKPG